ncbi:MAG: glycosyltransferase [Candidatus Moduliflexus flocculans]|nr:glycosyltransferase [Candidatus Moduliflexus flocculans]
MNLAGFETIRATQEVLWPLPLGGLANRFLVRLWPFNHFALSNLVIARPAPVRAEEPNVSVVIAASERSGEHQSHFRARPADGTRDRDRLRGGTFQAMTPYAAIEREIASHPSTAEPAVSITTGHRQSGRHPRSASSEATGDILMILDADLTVPPEDLPRFYEALVSRQRRVHQRRAPRLPDGEGSHAHAELHRQQVLQHGVLVAAGTAHQGHVVRHQGVVARRTTN